jgi:hypothetical protein
MELRVNGMELAPHVPPPQGLYLVQVSIDLVIPGRRGAASPE